MFLIYPTGPIAGNEYLDVARWHKRLAEQLGPDFKLLSQLRGSVAIVGSESFAKNFPPENVVLDGRAMVTRDFNDVLRCDALFVNFLGAQAVSIGSHHEIAWAYAARKPIIVVMEDKGNPNDHPFVRTAASFRTSNFDLAVKVVQSMLRTDWP
ncbi:MAG: hypothetical protein HY566_03575 [Candidatus Kerfeldbacteria bacterium]|nr:hypothetical protein [Candidatus Kerfeldbacteria bacterium]